MEVEEALLLVHRDIRDLLATVESGDRFTAHQAATVSDRILSTINAVAEFAPSL
jgi:hypothetical protein